MEKKLFELLYIKKILIFAIIISFILNSFATMINANPSQINILDDDMGSESYDLLIVCPKEFSNSLQPLVQHKNKYDVKTKLATMQEVYTQVFWRGKDDAEKLKYFIFDAKEEWNISYVLLIGGRKDQGKEETWWVPVRYTSLIRDYKGHEDFSEGDFLSDLYFADIYDSNDNFSSWDDDGDGIFGEWYDHEIAEDIPDLYPDVAVGRLPCRNNFDVRVVVDKIIDYETASFDDSWFKKLLVIAGDTYPVKTDYIDGEIYTQQAIDIMSDFESVKIWSTLGNLHWIHMVKELNKGCGFVFFSGHGGGNGWATHPPYDIDNWIGDFKLKHMNFLFNRKKLPICLSASGCFNNIFKG